MLVQDAAGIWRVAVSHPVQVAATPKRSQHLKLYRRSREETQSTSETLQDTIAFFSPSERVKKANLKEWALKSSKTALVRAIVDLDLNQQEQLSSHADERVNVEAGR